MKRNVYTEQQLIITIADQSREFREHGFLRLSWSADKGRTLSQNALAHAWYEQISAELGQDTPEDVKAECKLFYGVPILRREDEDFRERYDLQIKPLAQDVKITLMRWLPVTSLMTTGQLSAYLDEVQKAYRGSVALQFPDGREAS